MINKPMLSLQQTREEKSWVCIAEEKDYVSLQEFAQILWENIEKVQTQARDYGGDNGQDTIPY